jgi:uncharacterized protein YbjT (DUF2867 family)
LSENIILVVGGTGYIGTRLVHLLLENGHRVRVTYRSIEKIQNKMWYNHPNLDIVWADVFHRKSLLQACKGCSVAYYLVHCMYPDQDNYMISDKLAAENMVFAVNNSEIANVIYLGGLGGHLQNASRHLKSRARVGKILRKADTPVTILQAAMIIGSGSTSFEILRYIVERLPVMITPKWVETKSQPIAIRNVIEYLFHSLHNPKVVGKTFDIGGPEILSYRKLMNIYAKEASLTRRLVISLPFNDPLQSSSIILNKIIPIDTSILKPLIGSLRNEVICSNNSIQEFIPQELFTIQESIRRSITELRQVILHDTFQFDGLSPPVEWSYFGDPVWSGGSILYDRWTAVLDGNLDDIWMNIKGIGGENGWYHSNLLWRIRGYLDELFGGPGIRRGRNHPFELRRGEVLDCWRVTQIKERRMLLLSAEMRMPGIASLCFKLKKTKNGKVILDQIACFVPQGLGGLIYWQLVLPFHVHIFTGLIRGIAQKSNSKIIYGPKYLKRSIKL